MEVFFSADGLNSVHSVSRPIISSETNQIAVEKLSIRPFVSKLNLSGISIVIS